MIGERVIEARTRISINQSELARRAELTPAAVWQIERNERTPNAETLRRLAKALQVTSDWLLGTTDDYTPADRELEAMFRGLEKMSPHDRETILRVYRKMAGEQ